MRRVEAGTSKALNQFLMGLATCRPQRENDPNLSANPLPPSRRGSATVPRWRAGGLQASQREVRALLAGEVGTGGVFAAGWPCTVAMPL